MNKASNPASAIVLRHMTNLPRGEGTMGAFSRRVVAIATG
jgi:hypothetical protein